MKFVFSFVIIAIASILGLSFHYKNDINPKQSSQKVIVYQSEVDNDDDDDYEDINVSLEQSIYAN